MMVFFLSILFAQIVSAPVLILFRYISHRISFNSSWSTFSAWRIYRGIVIGSFILPVVILLNSVINPFSFSLFPFLQAQVESEFSSRYSESESETSGFTAAGDTALRDGGRSTVLNQVSHIRSRFLSFFNNAVIAEAAGGGFLFAGIVIYGRLLLRSRRRKKYLAGISVNRWKVGRVSVLSVPGLTFPFSEGVVVPQIFIPHSSYSDREQKMVILHELNHIKKHHLFWIQISVLLRSLFWWNPLYRWLDDSGKLIMEYIADQSTADETGLLSYCRLLMESAQKVVSHQSVPSFAAGLAPKQPLVSRIQCLTSTGRRLGRRLSCCIAGGAGLVATAAFISVLFISGALGQGLYGNEAAEPLSVKPEGDQSSNSDVLQFQWPLNKPAGRITQFFGPGSDPFGKVDPYSHKGIDIAASYGTPVYASQAGTVRETGYAPASIGHYVLIEHESGYSTFYSQLDSVLVSQGDLVLTETRIGLLGNSGMTTGPHLHFEIRMGDTPIDPVSLLED